MDGATESMVTAQNSKSLPKGSLSSPRCMSIVVGTCVLAKQFSPSVVYDLFTVSLVEPNIDINGMDQSRTLKSVLLFPKPEFLVWVLGLTHEPNFVR